MLTKILISALATPPFICSQIKDAFFSKHISIPSTWKSSYMISFLVTLFYQTVTVLNHNLPNYISTGTDNGAFAAKMKGTRTALVKKIEQKTHVSSPQRDSILAKLSAIHASSVKALMRSQYRLSSLTNNIRREDN